MSRRVALLGGGGTFSEEAAQELFGADWVSVSQDSLGEVHTALVRGEAELAILPVENSIAGIVEESFTGWRENRLQAIAEHVLAVRQCLLALPGAKLAEIKEVWSHPHAIAQCRPFLHEHGLTAIPTGSTVAAAQMVSLRRQRQLASLGSERIAERWGLTVLAADVQSVPDNFTRFVAVSKSAQTSPSGQDKTIFALELERGASGLASLFPLLEAHGVRLLRLHVSPQPRRPWSQVFYLEVEGHAREAPLTQLLPLLEERAGTLQWMGSYPSR